MTFDAAKSLSDLAQFVLLGGFGLWLLGAFDRTKTICEIAVDEREPDIPEPPKIIEHCYSHNGEIYHGRIPALIDALDEAFANGEQHAWVGVVRNVTAGSYIDRSEILTLIERLQQNAADDCGEAAEDWLCPGDIYVRAYQIGAPQYAGISDRRAAWYAKVDELAADIGAVVDAWADRHQLQPEFYGVDDPTEWDRPNYEGFSRECR